MSVLVLKNINKTFPGDQQAIRDFNLEVKDREFLILVGPTACGKSTLLRMIGGLSGNECGGQPHICSADGEADAG